jgi:anti-anti-sigma regulatory factor
VLKISVVDTKMQRRVVLEGKLIAPWSAELRCAGKEAATGLTGRQLLIDLKNLTAISEDGEAALLELMKQGARFCCSGVFTRHVLKQLARRARASRKELK